MVMPLKHNINVIPVKHRRKLCAQNHAVCVGMVQTGAVYVLMNCYHAPHCIREILNCHFNALLMFGYIVIVGI